MDKLLLGIDVGTTAAKAVLFTLDGRVQAVTSSEYPVYHPHTNWAEQNAEDWWNAVCLALRQVLSAVPEAARRVAGIGVSSQAPSVVALDKSGQPLRPAMIWMDRRAEAEAKEFDQHLGEGQTYRISGNRPDAFYIAPKLRWLKHHEPHILTQTHKFVMVTGYINYRLTGNYSLDNVHGGLLQLRHYADDAWSPELFQLCGVESSQFPNVQPGHHLCGEVTREAAEATGLRAGTPVVVGTVDGSAAAVEAGAVDLGTAAEMTGTSTVLLIPNDGSVSEPAFIAMPHAIPGIHLLLGAMSATGASMRWYRDQLGIAEVQAGKQFDLDPFDLLTQQAAKIDVGSQGVIFLPYMMGERAPIWHTNARGVFFGLTLATQRGALIRAILEGTTFALRHNVEVARAAGVTITEMRSVGGGTRNTLWNQIKADVLGIPVLLPQTSVGAPFGGAILAGMALGFYPDVSAALRQMVTIQTRYEPNPDNHSRYNQLYSIYRAIYDNLRSTFDLAAH
jgi:xylulokinase